jgi:type IV pilus assembly protein PilY1
MSAIPMRFLNLVSAAAAVAATLLAATPVVAEDTELFVGEAVTAPTARPNIMFILDTSGSMSANVLTQVPYDPDADFGDDYDNDRIYWKRKSQALPPCNSDSADRDWNDDGNRDCDRSTANQWVGKSYFTCDKVSRDLRTPGFAIVGKAAQWVNASGTKNDKWDVMRDGVGNQWVECEVDAGVHGQTTAGNKWAANKGDGPWNSNSSKGVDWKTTGDADVTFYTGHYLNWAKNPTTSRTRLEIMQEAATNLLDNMSDNVNVGLMRYSNDSSSNANGGMVMHPIEKIEDARGAIKTAIMDFQASGWTPLSETLYEAHQYFIGGDVVWGRTSDQFRNVDDSDTPSDPTACVGGVNCTAAGVKYKSPMTEDCQRNFIVFLTDGLPTRDVGSDPAIETLIGKKCDIEPNSMLEEDGVGICTDDLARYMQEKDLLDDEAIQNVTSYWVGLDIASGKAFLTEAATAGGGKFYAASNSAELAQVFTEIVSRILDETLTFTAPTVAVNAFNRTQNLNYLYMSVFKPAQQYRWEGNIKKYQITPEGEIRDANDLAAVNPSTGFFKPGALSYWSDVVDGDEASLGGAAGELTSPGTRKVYTMTGAESGTLAQNLSDLKGSTNYALVNPLFFKDSTETASPVPDRPTDTIGLDGLIDWAYGVDVLDENGDGDATDARADMGDPLHSRPATVIYGGPADDPDITLYATTNDGYLQAINAKTGKELWSFIPKEMLKRLEPLMLNDETDSRDYGLDGSMEVARLDRNGNGTIESSEGDRVYLYFGMRRGGYHYYAVDVTTRTSPKLMWRIGRADSGIAVDSSKELPGVGQTWSSPTVARVNIDRSWGSNADKMVLIFGGGYDTGQDSIGYSVDGVGNRIFMVDALTGDLIWYAGDDADASLRLTKMTNAIPGEVRAVDLTGDGFTDRMYAADLGGRVWRFDIKNGATPANLVVGGVFASLGTGDLATKTGTAADEANRRFFYAPDVALMNAGSASWINVAIGSGHREKPITDQTAINRFYSLRDYNVFTTVASDQYKTTCLSTETAPCHEIITDAGATRPVDVTGDITPAIPARGVGWKMDLQDLGEKVLAESRTFQNKIYITTYSPQKRVPRPEFCSATVGLNRLYIVDAATAKPVTNLDTAVGGDLTIADRFTELAQGSIAPEVIFVFPTPPLVTPDVPPANCASTPGCVVDDPATWPKIPGPAVSPVCLVGLESCGSGVANPPVRTYWRQRGAN